MLAAFQRVFRNGWSIVLGGEMSKPFLSIVIPCYNSKYLDRGLQSIVDCEMDDIEVILADDCST